MRKSIKNYTSRDPVSRITNKIQEILARAGAKKIMFDFDMGNNISGITFGLEIEGRGFISFALPISIEKVAFVMYETKYNYLDEKQKDQARRTSLKNIHDWIDAQWL